MPLVWQNVYSITYRLTKRGTYRLTKRGTVTQFYPRSLITMEMLLQDDTIIPGTHHLYKWMTSGWQVLVA